MSFLVVGVIVAVIGIATVGYVASMYNSMIQVKNGVDKAWSNIDVLLQQRHDELSNLVEAVRGYLGHERSVLEELTRLRSGYGEAKSLGEKVEIENQLNRKLSLLGATWESYPELRSSENVMQLQERISGLESAIADRRELFNDSVNLYNIQIQRFPELYLARRFGFDEQKPLEAPAEAKRNPGARLS